MFSIETQAQTHFIFITGKDCGIIQVSAGSDTYDTFYGLYSLSEDKKGPTNPVWKLKDEQFYIFNSGNSFGLRIGEDSSLKSGSYLYKSKWWCNQLKK